MEMVMEKKRIEEVRIQPREVKIQVNKARVTWIYVYLGYGEGVIRPPFPGFHQRRIPL